MSKETRQCINEMYKELNKLKTIERQKKYRFLNYQRMRMNEKEKFYEGYRDYIREMNKNIVVLYDI